MKRTALGRGLEALIPPGLDGGAVTMVEIEQVLSNPYQPRSDIDEKELDELVASIRSCGVVQPILVRSRGGKYELICGERRLRAAAKAGLASIPAIVREASDREILEWSLVENLQREGLNPLEEARAYERLVKDFDLTQSQIAERVGKSRATVANALRLLGLPEEILQHLATGRITGGHARAILMLEEQDAQVALCHKILKGGLTVRQAEREARYIAEGGRRKRPSRQIRDPHLAALEQELAHCLGTRVRVKRGRRVGRIEIEFYSDEDLGRIVGVIGVRMD
jgi:ParB family chromosome partitioning protein